MEGISIPKEHEYAKASKEALIPEDSEYSKEASIIFHTNMTCAGKLFKKVRVQMMLGQDTNPTMLGASLKNLLVDIDKVYPQIIQSCNNIMKKYVEQEGPEVLSNSDVIDAAKDFRITYIYISQKADQESYLLQKPVEFDSLVAFCNYNDEGRGWDALFRNGRFVTVRPTP